MAERGSLVSLGYGEHCYYPHSPRRGRKGRRKEGGAVKEFHSPRVNIPAGLQLHTAAVLSAVGKSRHHGAMAAEWVVGEWLTRERNCGQ